MADNAGPRPPGVAHDLHPVDGLGGQQRYCPRCKLMGSTETFQTYDCINQGGQDAAD